MDRQEREEIRTLLREELQDFFSWIMEELGGEYFIEHTELPPSSWEREVREKIGARLKHGRQGLWERDRYAVFDHPDRPSVYRVFDAEDLELLHYPEQFTCEHFKALDVLSDGGDPALEPARRFDHAFGVLLASKSGGWMYRLDFCEACGLIEIWSMRYDPDEIAQYEEKS